MTARLFTLNPLPGFRPKTFAGHRDAVVAGYFSLDGTTVSPPLLSPFAAVSKDVDLHCQQRRGSLHLEGKRR